MKASTKADEVVRRALEEFSPRIAIASSFSMEDVVLIDLAVRHEPAVRVFALDTGRLNEETYACAEAVRRRYGIAIEWFFPLREAVERLEREKGLLSFRESLAARHECCHIRKVEPLARALVGLKAWITGMRREQSATRASVKNIEEDLVHPGLTKINPLADWDTNELQAYVKQHNLPVNKLYARGYTSIGCAPCTRAAAPGEPLRAGRWWWESPEHKECGLHIDHKQECGTSRS
ncbi:MAG: phosphoadenylyl-sulfate reductase [Kiritimatiellia bacterium]|jgi:phosphoadenosine phosphosulfate reductase